MKNRKGFTLIELLAVVIILGVLMIIAIPSVTEYISDSRKSAYINTAREIIGGARTFVNKGDIPMYDVDTTYYINSACISTENASRSPYGEFTKAYIVVTYDGSGYNYYWTSVDETGHGIKKITDADKLNNDLISANVKIEDIIETKKIEDNSKYIIIDADCKLGEPQDVVVEMCTPVNPSLEIAKGNWPSVLYIGDEVTIYISKFVGFEECETRIVWQYQVDDNAEWNNIDPSTDTRFYLTDNDHILHIKVDGAAILGYNYRVALYYR